MLRSSHSALCCRPTHGGGWGKRNAGRFLEMCTVQGRNIMIHTPLPPSSGKPTMPPPSIYNSNIPLPLNFFPPLSPALTKNLLPCTSNTLLPRSPPSPPSSSLPPTSTRNTHTPFPTPLTLPLSSQAIYTTPLLSTTQTPTMPTRLGQALRTTSILAPTNSAVAMSCAAAAGEDVERRSSAA